MAIPCHHAAQTDCDHSLNANLLVQQLSNGPQPGFSKIGCSFVHEDIDDDILWKLRLDEHQQPPEIVRDIVVEVERRTSRLGCGMTFHESVRQKVPSVINDSGFGGHLLQASGNGLVAVCLHLVSEGPGERQAFAHHVNQKDFIWGKVFQGTGLPRPALAINQNWNPDKSFPLFAAVQVFLK